MKSEEILNRFQGSLLGLAIGDALGAAVEFKRPGTFEPVTGYRKGGPFGLNSGEWTDDTSLALCLAESLTLSKGFSPVDQLTRYLKWYDKGYLSVNCQCFDIGITTREALLRFRETGDPFSGPTDKQSTGNGSLMRLSPVPLFYYRCPKDAIRLSGESSRTTHGNKLAVDACRYAGGIIAGAMQGKEKSELLSPLFSPIPGYWKQKRLQPEIAEIANGSFLTREPPEIKGSGYVVRSLEAALWAFAYGKDFRESVLLAVNLGDDADTTGAICGQIAGSYYGLTGIPEEWVDGLSHNEMIKEMAERLYEVSEEMVVEG